MAKLGERAVVLGASMAGLAAARALAEFFETVTVVERDALSDGADHRRGVPQGRQIHALLLRGAQALEELFPGILEELVGAGAPSIDYRDLSKLHFNMGGHLAVQSGSFEGLRAYSPSRPFLESHVRVAMIAATARPVGVAVSIPSRKARNVIRRSASSAMVRVTSATERPRRSIAQTTRVSSGRA